LPRFVRTTLHEEGQTGARRGVAHSRQLPLPGVGVGGIGKANLTVPVPFCFAPVMSIPIRHDPILTETTFHGLEFLTSPGRVFTPRATTEALVDAALQRIDGRRVRVADVGTGAGVIAVSIAAAAPQTEVFATDINPAAVALARENAERNGVADRVHVFEGDLLDPVPALCRSSSPTCRTFPRRTTGPSTTTSRPMRSMRPATVSGRCGRC
jgi:hypothetical protein